MERNEDFFIVPDDQESSRGASHNPYGDSSNVSHNVFRPLKIYDVNDNFSYRSNLVIRPLELGSYLRKLRSDLTLQIGLYRGILGYEELYKCLPFKDRSRRDDFVKNWLHVHESPQAVMNVIDDLKEAHYRRAFVVGECLGSLEPLEMEAFVLASRIWSGKARASSGIKATNTEGIAPSTLLALSDQNRKHSDYEVWGNVREISVDQRLSRKIEVLKTVVHFLDNIGINLLEQDPSFLEDLLRDSKLLISVDKFHKKVVEAKEYYEETKRAGLFDRSKALPNQILLMDLADRVWGNIDNVEFAWKPIDNNMEMDMDIENPLEANNLEASLSDLEYSVAAGDYRPENTTERYINNAELLDNVDTAIELLQAIRNHMKKTDSNQGVNREVIMEAHKQLKREIPSRTAVHFVELVKEAYDFNVRAGTVKPAKLIALADRIWGKDRNDDDSSSADNGSRGEVVEESPFYSRVEDIAAWVWDQFEEKKEK